MKAETFVASDFKNTIIWENIIDGHLRMKWILLCKPVAPYIDDYSMYLYLAILLRQITCYNVRAL